jgi:two-component sensor histidine kinase
LGVGRSRLEALLYAQDRIAGADVPVQIDFSGYVENLIGRLLKAYQVDQERISVSLDIEPVPLDLRKATACGLIISELVSNAFKYAFPDVSVRGCVSAAFHRHGEEYLLEVKDDGIGFAPDLDVAATKTQGLRIVSDLVDHLQGRMRLKKEGGAGVSIVFPA